MWMEGYFELNDLYWHHPSCVIVLRHPVYGVGDHSVENPQEASNRRDVHRVS